MTIRFSIHFEVGHNPERKDWLYMLFSYLGWTVAVCVWCFHAQPEYWGTITLSVLRILGSVLFLQPLYRIAKSLQYQWYKENIYLLDIFLFLLYITVSVLIATDHFYMRPEWIDWLREKFFAVN